MTTLVLAEHDNQRLNEATAKTVSAAQKLGGEVHVLVAGKGAAAVAAEAAKLAGVTKVLLAEADALEHGLAEPLAALIVSLAGSPMTRWPRRPPRRARTSCRASPRSST